MFSKFDDYERFMGRWSRLLAPAMMNFVELRDSDEVLDIGSGTGVLSRAILDATRTAVVTAVDPSQEFVTCAAARRADPRVHFEVGDAQHLRFGDATFDKTLSMLVMNFIPDPASALREMARVTRPSGVVAAAVWDYSEGMQMLRIFWDEAIAFDPAIEPRDEAHMPLCKKGQLATLWKQQGLADVQEVPLTVSLQVTSFDDFWAPFLLGQGPAGAYVATLSKERQSSLERRLRTRVLGNDADRAVELRARAWAVKGTVS